MLLPLAEFVSSKIFFFLLLQNIDEVASRRKVTRTSFSQIELDFKFSPTLWEKENFFSGQISPFLFPPKAPCSLFGNSSAFVKLFFIGKKNSESISKAFATVYEVDQTKRSQNVMVINGEANCQKDFELFILPSKNFDDSYLVKRNGKKKCSLVWHWKYEGDEMHERWKLKVDHY